jgi:hypothetical protein
METITFNIYRFNELSGLARERAIDSVRDDVMTRQMNDSNVDWRKTLNMFCGMLNIENLEYEVNEYTHSFSFSLDNTITVGEKHDADGNYLCDMSLKDLSGRLLYRYFYNIEIDRIRYPRKHLYHKHLPDGRFFYYYSKVLTAVSTRPLTDEWQDAYILLPLWKWIDCPDSRTTYRELMERCLENFFSHWQASYKASASDDFVADYLLEAGDDGPLFHADGRRYIA